MKVKFGWAEEDSSLLTRNVVGWLGTHWTAITAGHTAPETHSLIHPPSEATSATYHSTSTHRAGWTCKYLKSGYLSNAPILLNYTSSIAAPTKVSWSATVHHTTTATESRIIGRTLKSRNKLWSPWLQLLLYHSVRKQPTLDAFRNLHGRGIRRPLCCYHCCPFPSTISDFSATITDFQHTIFTHTLTRKRSSSTVWQLWHLRALLYLTEYVPAVLHCVFDPDLAWLDWIVFDKPGFT